MLKINAAAAAVGAKQFQGAAGTVSASALAAGKSVNTLGLNLRMLAGGFLGLYVIRDITKTMVDFERTMRTVKIVTRANTEDMKRMTTIARELGATTRFTATEAGEGMTFLARAGFEAADVMEMIPHTLNLATAAVIDLGAASDMVANTIHQFGLKAWETERVVDSLMNTANNANTDVFQLGNAMQYAGTFAGALGITLEETNAALGIMANSGIKSSMAGTSLRGVFAALIKPTDKAMRAIDALGLKADDVNPSIRTLEQVFHSLSEAGKKLGDTTDFAALMLQIFARRPVPGALALAKLNEEIGKSVALQKNLRGETARAAKEMDDTLFGSFKALRSAVQELWLSAGDGGLLGTMRVLSDVLVSTTRILGGMERKVDKYKDAAKALSIVIKILVVRLGALMILKVLHGLFLLVGGAVLLLTGRLKQLQVASAANWITALATAVALVAVAYQEWANHAKSVAEMQERIQDRTERVSDLNAQAIIAKGKVESIRILAQAYNVLKESVQDANNELVKEEAESTVGKTYQQIMGLSGGNTSLFNFKLPTWEGALFGGKGIEFPKGPKTEEFKSLQGAVKDAQGGLNEFIGVWQELSTKSEETWESLTKDVTDYTGLTQEQLKEIVVAGTELQALFAILEEKSVKEAMKGVTLAGGGSMINPNNLAELEALTETLIMIKRLIENMGGDGFTALEIEGQEEVMELGDKYTHLLHTINMTKEGLAKYNREQELATALKKADGAVTSDEVKRLKDLAADYENAVQLQSWLNDLVKTSIKAGKEKAKIAKEAQDLRDLEKTSMKQLASDMKFNNELLKLEKEGKEGWNLETEKMILKRQIDAATTHLAAAARQKLTDALMAELEVKQQLEKYDPADKIKELNELIKEQTMLNKDGALALEMYQLEQTALAEMGKDASQEQIDKVKELIAELGRLKKQNEGTKQEMLITNHQFAQTMTQSIMSVVKGAATLEEAFTGLIIKLMEMIIQAIILDAIWQRMGMGGGLGKGGVGVARQGAVMSGGEMQNFATGGVVHRPTMFPMANGGVGLMGEAGAEAIMPLTRLPSGDLGVKAEGGGGKNVIVNMNITTQDADSFRKSKKQIQREIGKGLRSTIE
jgi:TP901 family phage tail tape measure protein